MRVLHCLSCNLCSILQVSAAAGQLKGIAQLLQQYRTQLQAAHASTGSMPYGSAATQGLLPNETLDELLFLVFLQGQFATRGWVQALDLYNVMKNDRGAGFAAGNAGVTAALLELLVCCGGTEGLLAAVQLVDSAHAAGECECNGASWLVRMCLQSWCCA
jgi:hypothetical protein